MAHKLIPYTVIEKALTCDPEALLKVAQNYDAYITQLSKCPVAGADGVIRLKADDDMKQELVLELLTKIPRFHIPELPDKKT